MKKTKTDLLIIDPQWDFCSPGPDRDMGALYVQGAEHDIGRIASMIDKMGKKINQVHVTLDCHHYFDIAHNVSWLNSDGSTAAPFTIVTNKDVVNGKIYPVMRYRTIAGRKAGYTVMDHVKDYTKSLEQSGRYPLCLWPPHCLIGTRGNTIMPVLNEALQRWVEKKHEFINFVSKGSNILTEHYSAVKAEVPDPTDSTTQLNTKFIETLENADELLICGEASSHCVANTVRDIADGFSNQDYVKKMILLTDGTSPVGQAPGGPDFPAIAQQFIAEMQSRGMQVAKTTDFSGSPVYA